MAHATHSNTGINASDLLSLIGRPFRAVWNFLVAVGENGHRMDDVKKLNAMSDEELAEKGLTRMGEINRIFGSRLYL